MQEGTEWLQVAGAHTNSRKIDGFRMKIVF